MYFETAASKISLFFMDYLIAYRKNCLYISA